MEKYSQNLQEFLRSVAESLSKSQCACFIRDHETFPYRAGFDIDLLTDEATETETRRIIRDRAHALSLWTFEYAAREGDRHTVVFILLDLSGAGDRLDWLQLELHRSISSPFMVRVLKFADLDFETDRGFLQPTETWRDVIAFRKRLKKGDLAAALEMAPRLAGNDAFTIAFDGTPQDVIGRLQRAGGTQPTSTSTLETLREKIARFLFCRTPFNKGKSLFFTVQGPDGAGKSSAIQEIEALLADLPIPVRVDHHVSSWKPMRSKARADGRPDSGGRGTDETRSVARRMLGAVYRRLPKRVQTVWLDGTHYARYSREINTMIYEERPNNTFFVMDRYIEDHFIKQIQKNGEFRSPLVQKFVQRVCERPMIAFVVSDFPEKVRERKQELTIDEIRNYYKLLDKFHGERPGAVIHVPVDGQTPRQVALTILREVFAHIEKDRVFRAFKSWHKRQES